MVRGSGKGGGGRGKGKSTGGRPDGGKSTGGAQEEKLMVDPDKPEMTPLLQMAYRKKQAAELGSAKKDAAVRRKQARQGAPAAESGPREDEDTEKLIRSLLEKASRTWQVGADLKRDMLAYLEASIRVASNKQSEISDIPRFSIPEDATFEDFVRLKQQRLERFNIVKSIDIEGLAVVTPPTKLETFQIIDVTRPSDAEPNKVVSAAQFLFSETNNYFLGGRPTPPDPTAKHGFFVFSNVTLPGYFGTVHHMSCSSRYSMIDSVKVSITCLPDLVKQFLLLTDENCKHISPYMVELLEVCMFLFGEFNRMQPPVDFLLNNFTYLLIFISAEVLVYMRNWSYLSKAAFAFYLGLLEISLGVVGCEHTFLRGRKQMASAVRKFTKLGCQLELRGEDGFFSLRKLAGSCLQLLKFDEEYIKRLIIRKNRKHSGAMAEVKGLVSVQCEADAKAEAEAEQLSKEELDKEEKEAEKELKHWVRLLLRDKMELIEALYQVNMDQDDNDQGVDEGEPSRSPASVPSSSGQGNELSDVLPSNNTVCSKVPSVPEHADSSPSSPGQGNKLSDVLPPNNTVCSKFPSAPDNTVCSKVPSASEHVDSSLSSPGQGNKLPHGLAHLCIVGGKLPSQPEYVSSGTSTSSECVTASSVVNTLGLSTSSSTGSLGSERKGLNPKAKEFKLNPNAKSFSTSPSLDSHHQSVSDAPYNYPNNMGLPVGIGSPQQYGGVPVVYNVALGSSPQSFMYPYGPQFLYNAQAGPSPENYMHPSAQFLYNAQSGPSPEGYMHPSGQLGPQQMMTGQTGPVYYHAHQNGRRNL